MTQKRLGISLPEPLSDAIDERVKKEGLETNRSAFIEHVLNAYFDGERNTASYEQELYVLRHTAAYAQEAIETNNENIAQLEHDLVEKDGLITELKREVENAAETAAECRERITTLEISLEKTGKARQIAEDLNAEYDRSVVELRDRLSTLENDVKESRSTHKTTETNNLNLMAKLRAQEENHAKALAEQDHRHIDALAEEERRHENITNALRHEQELTQQKLDAVDHELQTERDHNLELRKDKEQLQKQLELVTLRLPAPKEGFWFRVFGRRKKEQDA